MFTFIIQRFPIRYPSIVLPSFLLAPSNTGNPVPRLTIVTSRMSDQLTSYYLTDDELRLVSVFQDFKRRVRNGMNPSNAEACIRGTVDVLCTTMSMHAPVDLVPFDEMSERHLLMQDLLQKLRQSGEQWDMEFTAQQIAIMLCLPLVELRNMCHEVKAPVWEHSLDCLIFAGKIQEGGYLTFVCLFVNCTTVLNPGSRNYRPRASIRHGGQGAEAEVYEPMSICQSTVHANISPQVEERDGQQCIYTKQSGDRNLFYIFNPSGSATREQVANLRLQLVTMPPFYSPEEVAHLMSLLTTSPDDAYQSWNMLTLCPMIHALRGSINLTIVWAGSQPDEESGLDEGGMPRKSFACLQLRWLTREIQDTKRSVSLDGEPQDLVDRLLGVSADSQSEYGHLFTHASNHTPIPSGTIAKVKMDTADIPKMKAIIDLQWLCMRLVIFSGAGGRYRAPRGIPMTDTVAAVMG